MTMEHEPQQQQRVGKGEQTRERILQAALQLFAERGYGATTLRDIAAAAGCSLGLTYRYFARKEELVLGLYDRLAGELHDEIQRLPSEPLAVRFEKAMRADLARIAPYRAAFGALFGVGLEPGSDVAVLGAGAGAVRQRVWHAFRQVVAGATDAPRPRQADELATVLYAAHLSLILFWLQDRTPGQQATQALIVFARDMLARLRPLLRLPMAARSVARLAGIIAPMFGPTPAAKKEESDAV